MILVILANIGVMTFLSLRRFLFVNLRRMLLRRRTRKIKIELELADDPTVIESGLDSEDSKIHSLDDQSVAMSDPKQMRKQLGDPDLQRNEY